jgi:hypothetical protein
MTSVEILQPTVGDALIDIRAGEVVGIDECTIRISSHLSSSRDRTILARFHGI